VNYVNGNGNVNVDLPATSSSVICKVNQPQVLTETLCGCVCVFVEHIIKQTLIILEVSQCVP